MIDHKIELDSPASREFGFTSDKFDGWLWRKGKAIYISFIISKQPNSGNLSKLFEAIQKKGYAIKVPTPFATMELICKSKGFKETYEYWPEMGKKVTVLVKKNPKK